MLPPTLEEAALPLDAPICSVEVYRLSALIHRRGELLPPERAAAKALNGASPVYELLGLPLGLEESSLRVALDPPGQHAVVDLQVALDLSSPSEEHSVEQLEQVKAICRRIDALRRQQRRLRTQAEELMQLRPSLPPLPKRPDQERFCCEDPVEAWLSLSTFACHRAEVKLQRMLEQRREVERLIDELRQARDRLDRTSSAQLDALQVRKKIQLRLREAPSAPVGLSLTYQVPGARWFPSYELRVDPNAETAELVMSALVAQATGEDWRGVDLALSTADLQRRCDLPELGSWRVGRVSADVRPPAWRPLPEDLPQLFADFDRQRPVAPAVEPPLALTRTSALEAAGATVEAAQRMIDAALEEPEPQRAEAPALSRPAPRPLSDQPMPQPMRTPMAAPASISSELLEPMEESVVSSEDDSWADAKMLSVSSADAPAPASVPALEQLKARKGLRLSAGAAAVRGSTAHCGPAPGTPRIAPDEGLLAFGSLVLGSGFDADRGGLRALEEHELLPELEREPERVELLSRARGRGVDAVQRLAELPLPRGAREVAESAGHFAYRFLTKLSSDLPADGAVHRIGVLRQAAAMRLLHRTVPCLDTSVYRVARLDNPLTQPLLAGPLDIFWGNDFLVTARLETTAPGAVIEANLGVEPRVKVVRNVRHSQHEEGLLSGRTIYDETVELELQSGLGQPCRVEVIERLPVTEERKLEISVIAEEPRAEPYEQKERLQPIRGGRRWRFDLEPGGQERCKLRYRMSLPSSSEIAGGGRRA